MDAAIDLEIPRRLRPAVACSAHRTDGGECRAFAVHGAEVCRSHGGLAPQVRAAARRRLLLATAESYLSGFIDAQKSARQRRVWEVRRLLGIGRAQADPGSLARRSGGRASRERPNGDGLV
jgi:hypothetical protein